MIFYAADQPTADAGKSIIEEWGPVITAAGVTIAALIAFAVAIGNRRQTEKHWRITSRRERFTTIATQLADPNPAVRTAGVYAMEALTNDWLTKNHWYNFRWTPSRRVGSQEAQACVNVLCAYLRLPYTPPPGATTITKQVITTRQDSTTGNNYDDRQSRTSIYDRITQHLQRGSATGDSPQTETHHEYRHDDKQIRTSIIDLIAQHTRPTTHTNPLHRPIHRLQVATKTELASRKAARAKREALKSHGEKPLVKTKQPALLVSIFRNARHAKVETSWSYLDYDLHGAQLHNSNFRTCIFAGSANFANVIFEEEAYFNRASFRQKSNFDAATFRQYANFEHAAFASTAECSDVMFQDAAQFSGVLFERQAHFGGSTFNGYTRFDKAVFWSDALFDNITLGDSGYISELGKPYAWLAFKKCKFESGVVFSGSFWRKVDFESTDFEGDAHFADCNFHQTVTFDHVNFQALARFNRMNAPDVRFRTVRFSPNHDVCLTDVRLSNTQFTAVTWPPISKVKYNGSDEKILREIGATATPSPPEGA